MTLLIEIIGWVLCTTLQKCKSVWQGSKNRNTISKTKALEQLQGALFFVSIPW